MQNKEKIVSVEVHKPPATNNEQQITGVITASTTAATNAPALKKKTSGDKIVSVHTDERQSVTSEEVFTRADIATVKEMLNKSMSLNEMFQEQLRSFHEAQQNDVTKVNSKYIVRSVVNVPGTNKYKFIRKNLTTGNNVLQKDTRKSSNARYDEGVIEEIKLEVVAKDGGTKRDYKLNQQTKFENFYEFLAL